MAYRKTRKKSTRSSPRRRYTGSSRTRRSSARRNTGRSRAGVQTIKLVIEQPGSGPSPQAVRDAGNVVPLSQETIRKAKF